ncbi:hypothetical protein D9Q98_004138 [Chlorella vulgaris]|uniref:Uncharacterized protein n=1 Tax=Chlorella vulgaris TaxID=3077 RepID=A0A9D4TRB0_CHLVU|nr:hypothetical protein D9Q98_004138 [Chlorella vulgaris]
MSAASSRGGGSGLDSLLAGVDPRFNRPSMQDMKAKGGTSKFAGTSQLRPNSSPPNPPATSPAPAAAVAAGGGSVFGLEHLLQPRSSPPQVQQRASQASSSSSLASLAGLSTQNPSTTGAFDDLLGGVAGPTPSGGGKAMSPAAVAAVPPPKPAASQAAAIPPLAQPTLEAASSAVVAAEEDPFALFGGPPPSASPAGSSAAAAASQPAAAAALPVADIDDGFLAAFAAPVTQPPAQKPAAQQQQQQEEVGRCVATRVLSGDFGDFYGSDDAEAPAPAPAPAPAAAPTASRVHSGLTAAVAAAAAASVSAPGPQGRGQAQGSGAAAGPGSAGATSSFGYERQPHGGATGGSTTAGQSRYRVFDFVEADGGRQGEGQKGAPAEAAAAASRPEAGHLTAANMSSTGPLEEGLRSPGTGGDVSTGGRESQQRRRQQPPPQRQQRPARPPGAGVGGGGGALHASSYQQPPSNSKEVVNELGQKAAKALQSSTNWFMKASRTLVTQVQQRLDGTVGGSGGAAAGGSAGRPSQGVGEPEPFHYDWAAQLARISPGSRSAAIEAMGEDDRLAVQRILDESTMGDSFMGSQEYDGYASSPSSSHQPEPRGQRPAQQPRAAVAAGAGAAAAAGGQPRDSRPHPTPAVAMAGTEHRRPAAAAAAAASAPLSQQPPQYDQLFGQEAAAAASAPAQPLQAEQRKRQALQVSSPPDAAEDLLGMHSTTGSRSVGAPSASSSAPPQPSQPATAAQQPEEDDLLGFSGGGAERAPSGGSHVQQPSSASSSTAHIDSLFAVPAPAVPLSSGGGRSGGRPGGASAGGGGSRPAAGSSSGRGAGLDSMIDLGGGLPAVDTAGFAALYQDDQEGGADGGDEPEMRRALRQRRVQATHERMMRQLAEKRARDDSEAAEKSGKVELRSSLQPKIDAWAAGKKDNIRALLASLHTVLWPDSGWTAPSMADMLDNNKVKRVYMKANLVVHPDKVKQKGGSLEQVTTADMVFHILNKAWIKFDA